MRKEGKRIGGKGGNSKPAVYAPPQSENLDLLQSLSPDSSSSNKRYANEINTVGLL